EHPPARPPASPDDGLREVLGAVVEPAVAVEGGAAAIATAMRGLNCRRCHVHDRSALPGRRERRAPIRWLSSDDGYRSDARRNESTASLNASGCSKYVECPLSGMTTSCEPGVARWQPA